MYQYNLNIPAHFDVKVAGTSAPYTITIGHVKMSLEARINVPLGVTRTVSMQTAPGISSERDHLASQARLVLEKLYNDVVFNSPSNISTRVAEAVLRLCRFNTPGCDLLHATVYQKLWYKGQLLSSDMGSATREGIDMEDDASSLKRMIQTEQQEAPTDSLEHNGAHIVSTGPPTEGSRSNPLSNRTTRKQPTQTFTDETECKVVEHLEVVGSDTESGDQATFRAQGGIYIALGSNLGDRFEAIEDACRAIDDDKDMRIIRTSPLYETEPMYVTDQERFLNGVCEVSVFVPLSLPSADLDSRSRHHCRH